MTQPRVRSLDATIAIPPMLTVTRVWTDEVVHIGATPIAEFPAADVTTRRHVMVHQLSWDLAQHDGRPALN